MNRSVKTDKPFFVLYGNGPLLNRGCEAILLSTMGLVNKSFGVSDFASCPHYTKDVLTDRDIFFAENLQHISPRCPPKRFSAEWITNRVHRTLGTGRDIYFSSLLPKTTACLVLGGDNLSLDYGKGLPRLQLNTLEKLHRRRVPTVIWGASIGPFTKDPELEQYAATVLKKVNLICVRESLSKQYLEQIGVVDNVKLAPDPAFTLETQQPELPEEIQQMINEPCLGFNLSPLLSIYSQNPERWTQQAAELLKALDEAVDMPILLIPHVFTSNSDDFAFLSDVLSKMPQTNNRIVVLPSHYNASQSKWVISKLHVFIGARTHATIAALSSQVPTLSLGYSVKAEGINKDIFNNLDWVLPLDELSPESLRDRVTKLLSQADEIRSHLAREIPNYRLRAAKAGEYLKAIVDN